MIPGAVRRGLLVEVQRRSARVTDAEGLEIDCAYSPEIDLREFAGFAVGDEVEYFPGDTSQEPLITAVLPRKSRISRRGPGDRPREMVLAANVDLLVAVSAPEQPDFNARLLDRFVALAEHFQVEALICMNKCDLRAETPEEARYLAGIGYSLVSCSARAGLGLEVLRDRLRGRMAVLTGASGVGKSSLIGALFPGASPRTGEVRERDGKGRHTTTGSRLYASADGLRVIDTPGLRELGIWGLEPQGIDRLWRDFHPYLGRCRFTDCRHVSEPGCAVRAAAESGKLPAYRLQSYYRFLETDGGGA